MDVILECMSNLILEYLDSRIDFKNCLTLELKLKSILEALNSRIGSGNDSRIEMCHLRFQESYVNTFLFLWQKSF